MDHFEPYKKRDIWSHPFWHKFTEPQPGKEVSFTRICPKFEQVKRWSLLDECCSVCVYAETRKEDGDPFGNTYFYIYTADDLLAFAKYVNETYAGANGVLMADIDMTGVSWTIICETGLYYSAYGEDLGYTGTFDGNGHVISNLTVKSSTSMDASCGLFGTVSGTVKNLGIEGFTFVDGGYDIRAGAVVGQLITENGLIENCYVVDATIDPGAHVTGGIAGCVYEGTIQNCHGNSHFFRNILNTHKHFV